MLRFSSLAYGTCVVGALLAGCAGGPLQDPQMPIGAAPLSWVQPNAESEDLVYVSNQLFSDVYIFSYPEGRSVGTLTGFDLPEGLCSDKRGDVYVTDLLARDIIEYAHGGSRPIRTLSESGYPQDCSVDPTTGDLAVANYGFGSNPGNIAIFFHAGGTPKTYGDPSISVVWNCAYDENGNLFADGQNSANEPRLVELPSGAFRLKHLRLNRSFDAEGSVQWDGQHIAIMGVPSNTIYHLAVSGSKARVVDSTALRSTRDEKAFWIQGKTLILTYVPPHAKYPAVGFWRYPRGGTSTKVIRGLPNVYGVTVSLAPL